MMDSRDSSVMRLLLVVFGLFFKVMGAEILGTVENASRLSVLDQKKWVSGGLKFCAV